MAPPDFTDTALFPSFANLPEPASSATADTQAGPHYLLGEIAHNMTVNKPTLVLADRTGASFALVFDGPAASLNLSAMGLRKGATAVVLRAERTPPRAEGKRGFVSVPVDRAGEVTAVPGPLERVLKVGAKMRGKGAEEGRRCERCSQEGEEKEAGEEERKTALMKCLGCGEVRYCSKVSLSCVRMPWLRRCADLFCLSARLVKLTIGMRVAIRRSVRFTNLSMAYGSETRVAPGSLQLLIL